MGNTRAKASFTRDGRAAEGLSAEARAVKTSTLASLLTHVRVRTGLSLTRPSLSLPRGGPCTFADEWERSSPEHVLADWEGGPECCAMSEREVARWGKEGGLFGYCCGPSSEASLIASGSSCCPWAKFKVKVVKASLDANGNRQSLG